MNTPRNVLLLSDFNTENLAALLQQDAAAPAVAVVQAPFGQTYQVLSDPTHQVWAATPDVLVVWTQPQRVISGFARALDNEPVDEAAILAEVDHFAALVLARRAEARAILVPMWVLAPWERGSSLLEFRRGLGTRDLLARMNQRLAEVLMPAQPGAAAISCVYMLDTAGWVQAAGARAFAPKAWYLGKIPFAPEVFKQAAAAIKSALRTLTGEARKLIVLDLDNTLWGGVVGDVGWENLVLGGHDGAGEALLDFQRALKSLTRRGVALAIVSKNDEAVALTALREHPEMLLRPSDFAGWRINWEDKAANLAALTAELNLGLHSVVFIDDNPAERARIRDTLPEVLVPEWPADPALYRKTLLELTCFDTAAVTQEDLERVAMYSSDRDRKASLVQIGSAESWLATLEMVVDFEPLNDANLPRAAQLLNKTNQMNLTTRRMTAGELQAWAGAPHHATWTIKVSDKFGDLGLTGLLSVEWPADRSASPAPCRIVDLVLSCRVMGRKIEQAMLAWSVTHARRVGTEEVQAVHRPTDKNRPCLEVLRHSGWSTQPGSAVFTWDVSRTYAAPDQFTIRWPEPLPERTPDRIHSNPPPAPAREVA